MAYGVTTDYFGLADTIHQIQSSAKNPATGGNAQATDSNGDVQCEKVFGNYDVFEASYRLVDHTQDTSGYVARNLDTDVQIGQIFAIDTATNAIVTGVEVTTSPTEHPMMSITAEQYFGETTGQPTYASGATVLCIRRAQGFGIVAGGSSRVTSGTLSLSGQSEAVTDSQGDRVQTTVYQGRADATADLTICTGTPTAVADTANGYALNAGVSSAQENTGYGTASIAVFKNLTPSA